MAPSAKVQMLYYYWDTYSYGEEKLTIMSDNCCDQNKNKTTCPYLCWRVVVGLNDEIEYCQPPPGHTRKYYQPPPGHTRSTTNHLLDIPESTTNHLLDIPETSVMEDIVQPSSCIGRLTSTVCCS